VEGAISVCDLARKALTPEAQTPGSRTGCIRGGTRVAVRHRSPAAQDRVRRNQAFARAVPAGRRADGQFPPRPHQLVLSPLRPDNGVLVPILRDNP
jgi:hypothetical protein